MTDRPAENPIDPRRGGEARLADALLARALTRARYAILWERLWPALAALATVVGLFLIVSWAGLWLALPPMGRAIGLFVLLLILAAGTVPILRLSMPSAYDGLRRLDRTSGLPHRPATAIADEMATTQNDPWSVALWRAHAAWAVRAARALRAGFPKPRLMARDPFALRALVLVLLVATFFAAGGERTRRIAAAFDWTGVVPVVNYRVDAWVMPPPYTARPPVILPGLRTGESAHAAQAQPVSVPTGSVLVIRSTGSAQLDIKAQGGIAAAGREGAPPPPSGTKEQRFTIASQGSITLSGVGDDDVTWQFAAIPDRAPTIALAKDPEPQARGALKLDYKLEDDYGVTDAKALFESKPGKGARPLYGPPELALVLPQARTRNAVGQTTKDLTEHPWAGVDVTMTLVARDEASNEGRSSPHEFRLPQRLFVKPLARALIEQRRNLALDAEARTQVSRAIDALTIAPDKFLPEKGIYLGLRSVYWQLANAKSDDHLREVVERLWQMAVNLEDGNVSDAEAALRAAQEALRQALERGATDEEIKKLMEQLRAALDKFMQALAEELRKNPQQLARPLDRNSREIRPQDLRSMLDRIENLARSGAKDAARKLLEELQSLLENLQTARPGQMDGDDGDDMMSALDELGDMIRKQQQLRDRTFRQGQDQRRERQRGQRQQQGQQGQQGQEGGQELGQLQQGQQALKEQLEKLLEELRKRGLGQQMPGQQGQGQEQMDQLGRAGEEMGNAQGQLGDGNPDGAVDSQGKALDAMRKGAQGLAQMMQQQQGQGPGGPGSPPGRQQGRANQETDPLGRQMRDRGMHDDTSVKVPGEIDVQRARRILDELRRRFGESFRPQLELEYIERLLKDF